MTSAGLATLVPRRVVLAAMSIIVLAGCGQANPTPTQPRPDQTSTATPSGSSATSAQPSAGSAATSTTPTTRRVLLDDHFDGDALDRTHWNTCH